MRHTFDHDYWESHWQRRPDRREDEPSASPYLATEIGDLEPGTALDAGCGLGAEAIWLARAGWEVTAADISSAALARARQRASRADAVDDRIRWVVADLSAWEPDRRFDLVTTHYAHPAMPQLAFYERIAGWVAPGGTLLIVGHLHSSHQHHDGADRGDHHRPPDEASATADTIVAVLGRDTWDVVTADEVSRALADRAGGSVRVDDVIVRAVRRVDDPGGRRRGRNGVTASLEHVAVIG